MKVHTDVLTSADMHSAARTAGVTLETCSLKGSRKRDHAFDFSLSGSSNRRPNTGHYGADRDVFAATWDEWGIFLNLLFDVDPNASMTYYEDREDFRWQTCARFDTLSTATQCRDHKWEFVSWAATGTYSVHQCKKCSAMKRYRKTW